MKVFAVFVLLLAAGLVPTHADTLTDNLAAELILDSTLPLGPGVAVELATNLMAAQAEFSYYTASEPDSLTLSVASVLKAIWLEETVAGATEITNAVDTPYPFIQSTIAIDDRASFSIYVDGVLWQPGDVINFGDVPVGTSSDTFTVETPEPATLLLLTVGLLLALMRWAQTSLRKLSVR